MKRFTKQEIVITVFVLGALGILTYFNMQVSLRRARDFQRKDDVGGMANALYRFHEDFGFYPPASPDGRIMACGQPQENGTSLKDSSTDAVLALRSYYVECRWGWDALTDISDPAYPPYLSPIPSDPQNHLGAAYRYFATPDHFQIFTALEGKDEDEYKPEVEAKGFICGTRTCNFGKGSPNTPLDKTLEEYENELRKQREK